jgi:hypothetical protein
MPVFRVSEPNALPSILEDLTARGDCLAEVIGPNRLCVSVLGSYNSDAMEMEAEVRIRAWQAAQRARGIEVDIDLDRRRRD